MGYTIKQKIEICLQSDANPLMTQIDLANWAMQKYNSASPPSQTTISRILSSKNDILGSKESDFLLVRRRKVSNPLLRFVLTEWMTQAHWERIPVTTPIIQLAANAIWNKLPAKEKDGNGVFSHKWCNHFVRKLNVNLVGSPEAVENNLGLPLNKVWGLDEKVGLKNYIRGLISRNNYSPKDMFTIDEFLLFYCVPLDQIFDVSSVDKGLSQTSNFSGYIITIMLGCNMDGSEKLNPLVVSKHDTFDLSESTISTFHANPSYTQLSSHSLANKVSEAYQITYKYNNNKWITSSTFQDYLLTLDHKLESVSPGRNIIIFLDDSSTHRLMNLEFKHIKLVYLENASKHNNPYNGLFNEVKFDYIPTSFGIVEEFKIVFRLQQYLEMINKQNNQVSSDHSLSPMSRSEALVAKGNECGVILSEKDYQVPFIKAIEWIKRSWDSISKQKIYQAWQRANVIDTTRTWPASDPVVRAEAAHTLQPLLASLTTYNPHLAYEKLRNVMNYLNVVIPWEINELLGLVNERAKVSLNYASIDEMINSC
ncbi:DDE-domain-containing protein, partial [Metschnikowia bicuspidata var. bicuspidata NRRL YB-4993]